MATIEELIGSDRPEEDPCRDAYDFMPFARKVADTIGRIKAPHGLVLAINGSWGSGKSTLLNFVVHEIHQRKYFDKSNGATVIEFNPWWFQTHEDLAGQFLARFQAELLTKGERLRVAAAYIGQYSDAIGSTVSIISTPFGSLVAKVLAQFKKREDISRLKQKIAKKLASNEERFVFIVDDIDRLAPADAVSLLRVIKALADFPNVIYILSYDHEVVAKSIGTYLNVDGGAYLEKLVQASFVIPAASKVTLRRKLFQDLDSILETYPGAAFDNGYWAKIFFHGIDDLIGKPRDLVRLVNSLAVTYPSVAGEVNPVDFIALEAVRIFAPEVYQVVREQGDEFVGASSSDRSDQEAIAKFHRDWIESKACSDPIRHILREVFPKFGKATRENFYYAELGSAKWRRDLRACSPDIFPVYFEFGVKSGVSRKDLDRLVQLASSSLLDEACELLLKAKEERTADGISRSAAMLERLADFGSTLVLSAAEGLLAVLFKVGDGILPSEDEDVRGLMSIPNRWRLRWTVLALFAGVVETDRPQLLSTLVTNAEALSLCVDVVDTIDAGLADASERNDALRIFSEDECENLKQLVCSRLSGFSYERLLELEDLDYVVHRWIKWAGAGEVRKKIIPMLMNRSLLIRVIERFLRFSRMQSGDDPTVHKTPRLDPTVLYELVSPDWLDLSVRDASFDQTLTERQRLALCAYESSNSDGSRTGSEPLMG